MAYWWIDGQLWNQVDQYKRNIKDIYMVTLWINMKLIPNQNKLNMIWFQQYKINVVKDMWIQLYIIPNYVIIIEGEAM